MLTIGEISKALHLNPRTIRYYEEIGLLPEPQRNEPGYRLYSNKEIERLRLVQRAKLLGLSLAEIKEITEYAIDGHCSALKHHLLSLVGAKLSEVEHKIRELTAFKSDLQRYHDNLSQELASKTGDTTCSTAPVACNCIGELKDMGSFTE